ncbi:misato homolog 1 isoform X1 [Olea europaea subsp. europaea]|uniref:Misato homolog 1 isoform X1 n=1 Tax=Olea europaea subsp. europaea TaxID=158383 RepID=A0A8S0UQF6_OLEEU|nr:misato homolog 1 isoform X1 [Olea europaea subsp. europaea]
MPISDSATRGSLEVHSIPMAARLRSSNAVLPFLESTLENLRKFGIARGALGTELLRNCGFGMGELEDMGETLSKMVITLKPYSEE